jgi:hypothetical protein
MLLSPLELNSVDFARHHAVRLVVPVLFFHHTWNRSRIGMLKACSREVFVDVSSHRQSEHWNLD